MNPHTFKRLALTLGGLGLAAVFAFAWQSKPQPQLAGFALPQTQVVPLAGDQQPVFESRFASSNLQNFAHASAITALPNGDLLSVWFAGSREGAADVQIRGARFDVRSGTWGEEMILATRESTQRGLQKHIRKLGNPVVVVTPDERLWMFYVSVSIGGWAASSINAMFSDDLGNTWSTPRQLVTSPFLNISTLVRGAPVVHAFPALRAIDESPRAGLHWLLDGWGDAELVTLTPGLGRYFGAEKGVLVARAPEDDGFGLQDGDVIMSIGGREPQSGSHAMRILRSYQPGESVELKILRDRRAQTLAAKVPAGQVNDVLRRMELPTWQAPTPPRAPEPPPAN